MHPRNVPTSVRVVVETIGVVVVVLHCAENCLEARSFLLVSFCF